MNIYLELHNKFFENLKQSLTIDNDKIKKATLLAKSIANLGEILQAKNIQQHQRSIISIFDEVFTDLSIAIYNTSCSLDKPADIISRRALELGIAIVYLWDLPVIFSAWKDHDNDLNFNEMIEYLSKDAYKSFLKLNVYPDVDGEIIPVITCRKIYRDLSNTIHGKPITHESILPDRFSFSDNDLSKNLLKIIDIENILLKLFSKRFFLEYKELLEKVPSLKSI